MLFKHLHSRAYITLVVTYSITLFNLDLEESHEVNLQVRDNWYGDDGQSGWTMEEYTKHFTLASTSVRDDNEDSLMVAVDSLEVLHDEFLFPPPAGYRITLEPASMHVIRWYTAFGDGVKESKDDGSLELLYSSPLRASGLIEYTLPASNSVQLDLIDINGRRIERLVDQEMREGSHSLKLHSNLEREIVPGVYFLRLQVGQQILVKKIVVIE